MSRRRDVLFSWVRTVFREYSLALLNLDSCFRAIGQRPQKLLGSKVVANKGQSVIMPRTRVGARRFDSQAREFFRLGNKAVVRAIDEICAVREFAFGEF